MVEVESPLWLRELDCAAADRNRIQPVQFSSISTQIYQGCLISVFLRHALQITVKV